MKIKHYTKLIKHMYSNKIVIASYFAAAFIGYLVTSYFNYKELLNIGYLVYYFVFVSFMNANIYLFDRWRRKDNKKQAIKSLKKENIHKIKFYNKDGFLGEIDSDKYAIALYTTRSSDLLLLKQVLNVPKIIISTLTQAVGYMPLVLVMVALGLPYFDETTFKDLTIGELLSTNVLFLMLNINIIIISSIHIIKYRTPVGFINYRNKELTSLLSEYLPVLSASNGWYCYSDRDYIVDVSLPLSTKT